VSAARLSMVLSGRLHHSSAAAWSMTPSLARFSSSGCLEVLEALDRGEVAARQRQLDPGLAVVVAALRHVGAGEGRRAADRGEEIEREAEMLHLLAGDQSDR